MGNDLAPADLDFFADPPWRFDVTGVLDAPPAAVWAAFTDNAGWTRWFKGCKECLSTSDPAEGVGSTRFISVNGLQVDERFIGWEPEKLWAFTVVDISPKFARRMAERAQFSELPDGRTQVDYRIAVEPAPWAFALKVPMGWGVRRSFATSFVTLNRQLRTGPAT